MASQLNIQLAVRLSGSASCAVGTGASGRSEPGADRNLAVADGSERRRRQAAVPTRRCSGRGTFEGSERSRRGHRTEHPNHQPGQPMPEALRDRLPGGAARVPSRRDSPQARQVLFVLDEQDPAPGTAGSAPGTGRRRRPPPGCIHGDPPLPGRRAPDRVSGHDVLDAGLRVGGEQALDRDQADEPLRLETDDPSAHRNSRPASCSLTSPTRWSRRGTGTLSVVYSAAMPSNPSDLDSQSMSPGQPPSCPVGGFTRPPLGAPLSCAVKAPNP